jgi:hypothetical protein
MRSMKTFAWLGLTVLLWGSLARSQAEKLPPPFSGTWVLKMQRSKVEAAHPPVSSEAIIRYDGKTWHFKRTHRYDSGRVDVWSIDLVVGSSKFQVEKDGPYVFRSRMYRDGDALVLAQDITASDGQKAKNTVRYSIEDKGNTLIEMKRKRRPQGTRRIGGFWSERRISKAKRYFTSLVLCVLESLHEARLVGISEKCSEIAKIASGVDSVFL